jgi:hypothetical protein
MIISQIAGGLGNQLFQYALGRHLAERHRSELLLDANWYETNPDRKCSLNRFKIAARTASWPQILRTSPRDAGLRILSSTRAPRFAKRLLPRLTRLGVKPTWERHPFGHVEAPYDRPLLVGRVALERQLHFDSEVFAVPDNSLLCGYWQCERYFSPIAETIRAELEPTNPLAGRNLAIVRSIESTTAVSLHVRRGDKVHSKHFPHTSLEFCRAAIEWYSERLANLRFFIFSDDAPWVWEHLGHLSNGTIVDHNGDDGVEDLRLMSRCNHHIIASSSFSWWAAWLCSHRDKIVVSPHPRRWSTLPNADARDVLPPSWIILDV